MNKLEEGFERLLPKLVIDSRFLKSMISFNFRWANKSMEYVEFLGGDRIGVNPVRFSKADDDLWCDMVGIDTNDVELLLDSIPEIDTKRKVASNPIFMTMMYLYYRSWNSRKLNNNDRIQAMREINKTFAYKVISGRMAQYFKFNLDPEVARAVAEKMSNKFILKKEGSWAKLIEYRANDVLPGGLHHETLKSFNIDGIQYTIADLYTRYKDVFKTTYEIVKEVKDNGGGIRSESKLESNSNDDGGGLSYKDTIGNSNYYTNFLMNIIYKPNDLIVPELIHLVVSRYRKIVDISLLKAMLSRLDMLDHKVVSGLFEQLIPAVIDFLAKKKLTTNYRKNIYQVINMLKGYTISNTVKDEIVHIAKDELLGYCMDIGNELGVYVHQSRAHSDARAATSALIVYLCARTLYTK